MLDYMSPQVIGLSLALGLGFLVGLEREWAANKPIGLRSFTLIGGAGGLAALLAEPWGGWLVAAGLVTIAALIIIHYLHYRRTEEPSEQGTTTAFAAVAVYLVGAAAVVGYQPHAVVLGGIIMLLLHWKQPLHSLVTHIGDAEFSAIIRFVLITLVVLPVLPNDTFGPYDAVNPFEAWLLVVLIVGLNLVGYVAFKLLPPDSGAVLAGVVGGLVSSTAATVSFAGMTRHRKELAPGATLIILLASTLLYARVAVELMAVAPALLRQAALPLGAFALVMLVASVVAYLPVRRSPVELPEQRNPARLKVALTFAALYVVIIVSVAAARDYLGNDAVYLVALISGLTNVDALTLSVGQLFSRGNIEADSAWRSIFLATLANLLFKVIAAGVLGTPALRNRMLALGGTALAVGIAMLLLWP